MKTAFLAVAPLLLAGAARARRRLRSAAMTGGAPCACAPLSYALRFDTARGCDADDLAGGSGVGETLCMFQEGGGFATEQRGAPQVTGVQWLEFGTGEDLAVIHQDDTRANVTLGDGDALVFDSVSQRLDPARRLDDQPEYVPGGVQVTVFAVLPDGGQATQLLSWSYTGDCRVPPLADGDRLGWLTFADLRPASRDFCPAAAASTPTPAPVVVSPFPTLIAVPISLGEYALAASGSAFPDAKAAKADAAKATKALFPSKSAKGAREGASERLSRSSKGSKMFSTSVKGAASPPRPSETEAEVGAGKDAYDAKAEKVLASMPPKGKQSKNGAEGAADGAAMSGRRS